MTGIQSLLPHANWTFRLTSWKKFLAMIPEHDQVPPEANHGLESQLPNGEAKSEGVCHVFSRVISELY